MNKRNIKVFAKNVEHYFIKSGTKNIKNTRMRNKMIEFNFYVLSKS